MRTKKQLRQKKENAGKLRAVRREALILKRRRLLVECFESLIEEERRLLAELNVNIITKL